MNKIMPGRAELTYRENPRWQ